MENGLSDGLGDVARALRRASLSASRVPMVRIQVEGRADPP